MKRVLSFILIASTVIYAPCLLQAVEEKKTGEEIKALYMLKNRHAPVEARKNAATECLLKFPQPSERDVLIILANASESKQLQQHIARTIVETKNAVWLNLLARNSTDPRAPIYFRKLALHTVFLADPELGMQLARTTVENPYEEPSLRANATSYLLQHPTEPSNQDVAVRMFQDKFQPLLVRKEMLVLLTLNKNEKRALDIVGTCILDKDEENVIRKTAIAKSAEIDSPLLQSNLIRVAGNREEKTGIRKAALIGLAEWKGNLEPFLPELIRIHDSLPRGRLRTISKKLIEKTEKTILLKLNSSSEKEPRI